MKNINRSAMRFIILMGIVSLFADMTYEAARGLNGPYLALLGAGGAVVGITAGLGELFGYGLRVFFGILSDKTKQYWAMTIIGYAVNLLAVPLVALAGHWELAAALMILERIGKAVRAPARDAILSPAAMAVGTGRGFAIHEALDQIGAITGPLITMVVLAMRGTYQNAYAVLAIPAVLAMTVLIMARRIYPHPQQLDNPAKRWQHKANMSSMFWLYLAAVGLVATGFADFPLIAYHVKKLNLLEDKWIPLLYAGAMAVDAVAALFFGSLYDKKGMYALMMAVAIAAFFAPLAFSSSIGTIIGGVVLWGVGMGAQESIIRSVVADIVPKEKRGTGFGLFNAGYGLMWFAGSAAMGALYDFSMTGLMILSVVCQLASLPLLYYLQKRLTGIKSQDPQ
jgi:MFS family permease